MRVLDVTHYIPQKDKRFLIDANVWLYASGANPRYDANIVDAYFQFLKRCEINDAKVYLLFVVISEFVNVWLKIDFKNRVKAREFHFNDYKGYRASVDGKAEASFVQQELGKMANPPNVSFLSDDFPELDVETLFSIENADINDNLIVAVAERRHLTVVTHDADF